MTRDGAEKYAEAIRLRYRRARRREEKGILDEFTQVPDTTGKRSSGCLLEGLGWFQAVGGDGRGPMGWRWRLP